MKKVRRKIFVVFLVLMSLLLGYSSSFAYVIWFSGGFGPVPTMVHSYNGFSDQSKASVSNACAQWNSVGVGNLVYDGSYHSTTTWPVNNGKNEITKNYNGVNRTLASCRLVETEYVGGILYSASEADIDLNISHPLGNSGSSSTYDVGCLVTHEIGHLLGLDHSADTTATMVSGLSKGDVYKRSIESDDKNGIKAIYN